MANGRPPYEAIAYYINDKANAVTLKGVPDIDKERVKDALRYVLESRKKPTFPYVSIKE